MSLGDSSCHCPGDQDRDVLSVPFTHPLISIPFSC